MLTFKIYRLREGLDRDGRLLMMAPEDTDAPEDAGALVHTFTAVTRDHAVMRFKDFSAGWNARAQATS